MGGLHQSEPLPLFLPGLVHFAQVLIQDINPDGGKKGGIILDFGKDTVVTAHRWPSLADTLLKPEQPESLPVKLFEVEKGCLREKVDQKAVVQELVTVLLIHIDLVVVKVNTVHSLQLCGIAVQVVDSAGDVQPKVGLHRNNVKQIIIARGNFFGEQRFLRRKLLLLSFLSVEDLGGIGVLHF